MCKRTLLCANSIASMVEEGRSRLCIANDKGAQADTCALIAGTASLVLEVSRCRTSHGKMELTTRRLRISSREQ